jgi:hypothetical protein
MAQGEIGPSSIDDLKNPAFLRWLDSACPKDTFEPEPQDFNQLAKQTTPAEKEMERRNASVRKLVRLYREWKSGQN